MSYPAFSDSEAEQEIIKLAHEWLDAIAQRDRAALERILADDFVIAGWLPEGRLGEREFYIEDAMKPIPIEQASFNYDQWKFRFHDNIAIVNCLFKCHALVAGNEWGGTFLFTDVWIKKNESWQVSTRHSSPVFNQPAG
jgi:ketosteroid isomerase-like protein